MNDRNPSVTISSVAKSAGVSISTVSRVLNKYPSIDAKTRSKVHDAVLSLGYDTARIDRKVRALAKAQVRELEFAFLLCPLPGERSLLSLDFYKEIFDGAQSFVAQLGGARLSLYTWDTEGSPLSAKGNETIEKRISQADAVLVAGTPSKELVDSLLRRNRDLVAIGNPCECRVDTVETDDVGGGMLAAKCFLDAGFKSIGFLDGPPGIASWTARRMGAMFETVQHLGSQAFQWRASKSTETKDLAETLREWLLSDSRPEALIVSHSMAVVAVEIALLSTGLKCPRDLSVISFDQFRNPSGDIVPTRLETYPRQLGMKAAQRAASILELSHQESEPHRILVPMRLVEGNSVVAKPRS